MTAHQNQLPWGPGRLCYALVLVRRTVCMNVWLGNCVPRSDIILVDTRALGRNKHVICHTLTLYGGEMLD